MKNLTLIPMVDFTLTDFSGFITTMTGVTFKEYPLWKNEVDIRYANFLKQPPHISMFVPATKEGIVLNEPINFGKFDINLEWFEDHKEYFEAKERVCFEGFYSATSDRDTDYRVYNDDLDTALFFEKDGSMIDFKTIEKLVIFEIPLTESKTKEILGL